jgi:hypothetical protein
MTPTAPKAARLGLHQLGELLEGITELHGAGVRLVLAPNFPVDMLPPMDKNLSIGIDGRTCGFMYGGTTGAQQA